MENVLLCEFEEYDTTYSLWIALKDKFCGTYATKLWWLTNKFDMYKKRFNTTMRQNLREMRNFIRELKTTWHVLSDEQQVKAVICSFPHSWEEMKVNLTHNESIIPLDDVSCSLELEDEHLETSKSFGDVFMV